MNSGENQSEEGDLYKSAAKYRADYEPGREFNN